MNGLDKNTVIIVSGRLRSGTSLMMAILEENGIPVIYSKDRDNKLYALYGLDANPLGFYEVEDPRALLKSDECIGKAVKCFRLRNLDPKHQYFVIYMERDQKSAFKSFKNMVHVMNPKRAAKLEKNTTESRAKLKSFPHVLIDFYKLIENPNKELSNIPFGNLKTTLVR